MRNEDDKITVLLECIRQVFPHLSNFPDELLLEKLGGKKVPFRAEEFNAYIIRSQPVGLVMKRLDKVAEGTKLLRITQEQMQRFAYPRIAITPQNVAEHLDFIDDWIVREDMTEERKALRLLRERKKEQQSEHDVDDEQTSKHGVTLWTALA